MVGKNIVTLTDQFDALLDADKPIFYTVKELFKLYPAIPQRGWREQDLQIWVSQGILIGRNFLKKNDILEVEKHSIELFLKYHNEILKYRLDSHQENIDELKKKRTRVGKRQ